MATITFSEKINDKPSCFPDLIWQGILEDEACLHVKMNAASKLSSFYWHYTQYFNRFRKNWDAALSVYSPKLHVITSNSARLFRKGMKIHAVVNTGVDLFQFCPSLVCLSIQSIKLENDHVFVDNKKMTHSMSKLIARHEGFIHLDEFKRHFNEIDDGMMCIIHWTKNIY